MELKPLPFDAGLDRYQKQAEDVLDACRAGDARAIGYFKERHPRFLDPKIPWLSKNPSDDEVRAAGLDIADAWLTVARWYDFRDWPALEIYVAEVTREESAVYRFECAVEAVI